MALLDWLQDRTDDEIRTLIEAIEAGEIPERADVLREMVEDESLTIREEAARATAVDPDDPLRGSLFNQLEDALGLDQTPPPPPDADEFDGDLEVVDKDRQDALERLDNLLQPGAGRDFQFFNDLTEALDDCDASLTRNVTQETMDALTDEDCEQLAERARNLAQQQARQQATVQDFPRIQSAIRRGPGRGVSYFEGILRELQGEAPAQRLPEGELSELRESPDALEEAVARVEDHIERLEGGDGGATAPVGGADFSIAPTDLPDIGQEEPIETTDYINGEPVTRDPRFEQKFISLARDLGRARRLDLMPEPGDYFELTPENQRRLFDVTPEDFMERAMRRGEVTRRQLINRYGFDPGRVPEP